MDDSRLRFGVGVLVVSALTVGALMMVLFGAIPSMLGGYEISIVFPTADGIAADSPVVRDGVHIGRVRDIRLRDQGGVVVRVRLSDEARLTHRYVPQIGGGNFVTGDARLEFVRADDAAIKTLFADDVSRADEPYVDDEFIDYGGRGGSLATMSSDIGSTFDSFQTAGDSITRAGDSLHHLVAQVRDQVIGPDGQVSREAVETLRQVQAVVRDVREVVGGEKFKRNIQRTVDQVPEVLAEARASLQSSRDTFESFQRAGSKFETAGTEAEAAAKEVRTAASDARQTLRRFDGTAQKADRVVANIEQFTEPLAERGEEIVDEAIRSLSGAQRTLAEIETFVAAANNSNGTVRRLLEDDDLYYQIRRTVENIELASARLRPILDDARVFSDKIARDPRQLGIRGALSKRPNGAGRK